MFNKHMGLASVNVVCRRGRSPRVLEAANKLMEAHGLLFPVTVQDAVCLYTELVALFEA